MSVRVALYSHDTCGLGHARRNTLIARTLLREGVASSVLLISGARETTMFPLPDGLDAVILPSVRKLDDGTYRSSRLGVSLAHLTALRSGIIDAAMQSFRPDLVVVDNVPRGANRELEHALENLVRTGDARVILGLRDVLDTPDAVSEEWARLQNFEFIRKVYDEIWVYGDPNVYRLADECAFPDDIRGRVRYTGYLNRSEEDSGEPATRRQALAIRRRSARALCMVGGGQDGFPLAHTFLRAARKAKTPADLVAGPYMPGERYQQLVSEARNTNVVVHRFLEDPLQTIRSARRIVAMGGYNTICEVLSSARDMLAVPRVAPRSEQLIRCRVLEQLGVLSVLNPARCDVDALAMWLRSARVAGPDPRVMIDFGGLERITSFASERPAIPVATA